MRSLYILEAGIYGDVEMARSFLAINGWQPEVVQSLSDTSAHCAILVSEEIAAIVERGRGMTIETYLFLIRIDCP